jgi:oligo-1,6-glucosidase
VVYQIYPKSFHDSDGDGVGDLRGIIGKLDYLSQLGVDVLWLSPIFPSPGYDNGYDISDYDAIDPVYGSMDDFDELLTRAHALGLRVLLDMVVNHSSSRHPWFTDARCGGPGRDYYIWRDGRGPRGEAPPNNWGALFGGPAWTREGPNGQYYLHLFSPEQPDLNWRSDALRRELYAMMRRWLARGVDGFRLDVVSLISKPDDYSDGPVGPSGYFDPRPRIANGPRVHEYLRELRARALAGYDTMTVGEASAVTLDEARRYTDPDGNELDMVFQFEHMDLDGGETFKWNDRVIPLPALKRVIAKWQLGMEGRGWNALFWNNHDQPRMLSRLGDEGAHRERSAKLLATCLHMLKGTPFIYQGEELGMTNMRFTSPEQLRDAESIDAYRRHTASGAFTREEMLRYISLKSRDNARTPMQWEAGEGAGFTAGRPWMDINPNHRHINAAEQIPRRNSVLAHYRALIALRRRHDIIVYGTYAPLALDDEHIFAYTRSLGGQTLLVCCNFSAQARRFAPPPALRNAVCLLTNVDDSLYTKTGELAPYEAVILLGERDE